MTHGDACKVAMLLASEFGCGMVTVRPVGLFYDAQGTPRILGIPGEADVQAVAPDGRAVGIEIKTGKRATRRQNQKDWATRFIQLGGLYCCAYWRPGEDGAETIWQMFQLAGYKKNGR